jgi:hypothetical protein
MKSLKDYILEAHDILGHEIKVGDWIQFHAGGMQLWGEVTEITNDEKEKYVVKTLGWYGDKSLRSKVKESYKVNTASKSVYLLNKIEK